MNWKEGKTQATAAVQPSSSVDPDRSSEFESMIDDLALHVCQDTRDTALIQLAHLPP